MPGLLTAALKGYTKHSKQEFCRNLIGIRQGDLGLSEDKAVSTDIHYTYPHRTGLLTYPHTTPWHLPPTTETVPDLWRLSQVQYPWNRNDVLCQNPQKPQLRGSSIQSHSFCPGVMGNKLRVEA